MTQPTTTTGAAREAAAGTARKVWKITVPSGLSHWFTEDDDVVAHFSLPEQGHKIEEYHLAAPSTPEAAPAAGSEAFQRRVKPWLLECFGEAIAGDHEERNHRFLEEALELVQACGCTASEAHQLVDYTFNRPIGEKGQEVGGVMVTLAALCEAQKLDMHAEGETELARINVPAITAKIRAKQAAKPKHSPLPAALAATTAPEAPQEKPAPMTREWCANYPGTAAGIINELARQIDAMEAPGKLDGTTRIRCRKCGEDVTVEWNYAHIKSPLPSCCGQMPCAYPGIGPCNRPAAVKKAAPEAQAKEDGEVLTDEQIDVLQEEYDCFGECDAPRIHDFARGVELAVRKSLASQEHAGAVALLEKARFFVASYALKNVRWTDSGGVKQDPSGVHALLSDIDSALTDSAREPRNG